MLLCIETSTPIASVALFDSEKQLRATTEIQNGSQFLASAISALLNYAGVSIDQLKAVSVSAGPGSYTGLRVGTSIAKGICAGLGIPLLAADTLQVMAASLPKIPGFILCPMLDAKRMEVYTALLNEQLSYIKPPQPLIIESKTTDFFPQSPMLFFGDGAEKCQPVLNSAQWIFVPGIYPRASFMAGLSKPVDVAYFEPIYLKEYYAKSPLNPLQTLLKAK